MSRPRALVPAPEPLTTTPGTYADGRAMQAFRAQIAGRVKPTRRRLNMLSAVATGWLPWGIEWPSGLVRVGNLWVLCCGHVMPFTIAQEFVAAGLLIEGKNFRDEDCLKITKAGKIWLQEHWPS